MNPFEKTLLRLAAAHLLIVEAFAFLFRVYLMAVRPHGDWMTRGYGLTAGSVFDAAVAVYAFLPLLALTLFLPAAVWRRLDPRKYFAVLLGFEFFVFAFACVGEFFFYDEFKDRFNFIAVDYLVYTHEVLSNIWESYPVLPVVAVLAVLAGAVAYAMAKRVAEPAKMDPPSWKTRALALGVYAAMFAVVAFSLREDRFLTAANFEEELLAKNGFHALFAAYRNNEINFDRFYTTMDGRAAASFVHNALEAGHEISGLEKEDSIVRNIREERDMQRRNVVLVIMESMSAKFMKAYGNPNDLTPNLDRLAREGLFFNRVYATGTRTVRGLEAIVLSIPPTPGQSIVRRPAGVGIFNIGSVFRDEGYETNFIYGGRALFDNMGEFFSGNGFKVLDQSSFPSADITFTNAWGVADEDLFGQVIKASDQAHERGRKFFHVVLNTSNHRPYTYPEGRVSIPSGKGRDGAVQYSDYAIGDFIAKAKTKDWFKNTIFIFVADHNASVAGQSKVDPADYLIPLIFYAPGIVKPGVVDHLGSQIDLAPTLLEMLSASYQSRFFGKELQDGKPGRAFLGTYQSVAYLTENAMTVLSPNRKAEEWSWDGKTLDFKERHTWDKLPEDAAAYVPAVAFYKTASDWFGQRLLDDKRKFAKNFNTRD